jgi:DNA-binding winged helix-turn-helix (wHTH) protein/TolB-like protein/Tfp pilus assembly protein PilF
MELKPECSYEYGPFRLEPIQHRLTRDGSPVSLAPKAFELLVFLIQNQGRLVTKDQIMRAVWPDSFVEDANLTVSISVLRKALGEKDGNLRYIETVPKRGYRFMASVKEVRAPEGSPIQVEEDASKEIKFPERRSSGANPDDPAVALQPLPMEQEEDLDQAGETAVLVSAKVSSTAWRWVAMPAFAVLACILLTIGYFANRRRTLSMHPAPVQHRLAILPLRNLSRNPNDDFLGFSLADAVITRLGPVSSLIVRSSSAIEKYKGQSIDSAKVAAELNVDTLLTGTFIHDGEDLRITYQLIDAKTDKLLGRDMIDLKYDKLLTVQDKVTQQIIKGLELNLSPSEEARIHPDAPVSPLSYEYYLRGVDLVGSHNFPMAIKMLEKAAELDPNYALTWAWLGQSYESAAAFEFGGREQYQKAEAAYKHALTLQPNQLEATMFLANLFVDTGKVDEATDMLRDALKSSPNHAALHWELGYAYRFAGLLKESVEECEHARQIDPLVQANGSALNAYLYLGEYDKFLNSLPDVSDSSFIVFYRGFAEYHQKKWDLAARDFDRAYELDPSLYTQIGKALSDSIAGKNSEGLELLQQAENRIRQREVGDAEATYKIAQAYAVLGDNASALRMLRYSIEHGFFCYPYFSTDRLMEPLRNDPEFSALMNIAYSRYATFKQRLFF